MKTKDLKKELKKMLVVSKVYKLSTIGEYLSFYKVRQQTFPARFINLKIKLC